MDFQKRPAFNKLGKEVELRSNVFKVKLKADCDIVQYDVVMVPEVPPSVARLVLQQFETQTKADFKGVLPVYDGRKALYAPGRLPGVSREPRTWKVEVKEEGSDPRIFEITLKEVAVVSSAVLSSKTRPEQQVMLQALDTVLRHSPSMRFDAFGPSFFDRKTASPLDGGLQLTKGYYQSVRASLEGLILNLDLSATTYVEAGPSIQILLKILKRRDVGEFQRGISEFDWQKAERFFRGVRVQVNYRGAMKRKYRVLGLAKTNSLNSRFFNSDKNAEMTVADYFKSQYGVDLQYPNLPCFRVGNPQRASLIPIEVTEVVPGQRNMRRLNEFQQAIMVKATTTKPDIRRNDIVNGRHMLAYENDPYASRFNISIEAEMMVVGGRVLPPPTLEYHASSQQKTTVPENGGWTLKSKKMPTAITLNSWSVICFGSERDFPLKTIQNFVTTLAGQATVLGVPVTNRSPPILYHKNGVSIEATVREAFQAAGNAVKQQPQIILTIFPVIGQIYGEVKRVGETLLGVATQGMLGKHVGKANIQYCANLTLKINAKLGGININLSGGLPFVGEAPTMVIGCDVNHPEPGDKSSPSLYAVVASWDRAAARYTSYIASLNHRQEVVDPEATDKFVAIMKNCFINFRAANKIFPRRVIFFRDGVSEGQFEMVCAHELKALMKAWRLVEPTAELNVSFIVVQKRHHVRFFPTRREHADRNGNVQPGTVIDQKVVSPFEWDFYLNSHGSLQGTSKPAHYIVLYDQNNFTPESLYTFIYHFCHTFCRACRTVSIVPPIYYADLLAFRARYHSASARSTDGQSALSGDSENSSYAPVVRNLDKTMYFV